MKYSIVIPCYNEEENLKNLIVKIMPIMLRYEVEFILVENGSSDKSREAFLTLPEIDQIKIKSVFIDVNRGYGFGILSGVRAATGDYIGWIHADMQLDPNDLNLFFDYIEENRKEKLLFLKGSRRNRNLLDQVFTAGMTAFESILFGTYLYDIGAIPVIFHKSLVQYLKKAPYDFSIELFTYHMAKKQGFKVKRIKIDLLVREGGTSSWNTGLKSKVRQSKRIMNDSMKIKKGEQVL